MILLGRIPYIEYLMDDNNLIKSTDEQAVEGELVEEDADSNTSAKSASAATVSLSLESLIKGHLGTLSKLKNQIAEQSDMFNNVLENDPTYKQHFEDAKKATKVKTATKSEIMKRPEVMQVVNKIKAAREEYKQQQQTLSELLAEYQRTTGLDSIETEDGKVRKIITTAHLG